MRQMIKGLLAALAVTTAGVAPAAACGWGGGCCNTGYVSPCAQTYAPTYSYSYNPCGTCNTGWGYERLAEPETQYYYVNQGPTYSGPGAFAPQGEYQEEALPTYGYGHTTATAIMVMATAMVTATMVTAMAGTTARISITGSNTATRRVTTAITAGAARVRITATRWCAATTDRSIGSNKKTPASPSGRFALVIVCA